MLSYLLMFVLIVAALILLVGLLIASTILRKIDLFKMPQEPMRIPAYLGWTLLLTAIAFNALVYDVGFGIGYGLFGVALILGILLTFPKSQRGVLVWFLGVTGIIACLLFGGRANAFVQVVNVATALICVGTLVLLRGLGKVQWHGLWFLKMKAGFLARFLHHPLSLGSLKSKEATKGNMIVSVIKTVVITLVVLIFFASLLSSADPVFDNLIAEVREQMLGRGFFTALIALVLFALLTVSVPGKWQEQVPKLKILGFMEMFVPALSLALLFGLFLFVQARYLFGSHADFQALDITYADYVRKGFLELLVASFVGSILCYALILKQHALSEARKVLQLKLVNGVLVIELVLLLASAAKRDWMYVEMYGLTRVRLIGALFLLWLFAVILLIFFLNTLKSMKERGLLGGIAISSAVVVLLLNALNIDLMIALSRPPRGERPDVVYMSRLSTDAVDGWLAALAESSMRYRDLNTKTTFTDAEKRQLADAKIAMTILTQQLDDLDKDRKWQEWNASLMYARQRIRDGGYRNPQAMAECIVDGIRSLQLRTQTELVPEENHRMTDYHSPFMFDNYRYWTEDLENIRGEGRVTSAIISCENN